MTDSTGSHLCIQRVGLYLKQGGNLKRMLLAAALRSPNAGLLHHIQRSAAGLHWCKKQMLQAVSRENNRLLSSQAVQLLIYAKRVHHCCNVGHLCPVSELQ